MSASGHGVIKLPANRIAEIISRTPVNVEKNVQEQITCVRHFGALPDRGDELINDYGLDPSFQVARRQEFWSLKEKGARTRFCQLVMHKYDSYEHFL